MLGQQAEHRAAAPDLDVVGVRAKTQYAQRPGGRRETDHAGHALGAPLARFHTSHGGLPAANRSSTRFFSFAVSTAIQNPS